MANNDSKEPAIRNLGKMNIVIVDIVIIVD